MILKELYEMLMLYYYIGYVIFVNIKSYFLLSGSDLALK